MGSQDIEETTSVTVTVAENELGLPAVATQTVIMPAVWAVLKGSVFFPGS
jgi:hypothetical protein